MGSPPTTKGHSNQLALTPESSINFQPIEAMHYTQRSIERTDTRLNTDAMVLYTRGFHDVCIFSSGSVFTRLASGLREEGITRRLREAEDAQGFSSY